MVDYPNKKNIHIQLKDHYIHFFLGDGYLSLTVAL